MSYKLSTKFPTNKIAKSNFSLLRWENCDEQTQKYEKNMKATSF